MILDTACDGNALATLAALEAVSNQVVEDTQVVALHHKSSSLAAATQLLGESEWCDHFMTFKLDVSKPWRHVVISSPTD